VAFPHLSAPIFLEQLSFSFLATLKILSCCVLMHGNFLNKKGGSQPYLPPFYGPKNAITEHLRSEGWGHREQRHGRFWSLEVSLAPGEVVLNSLLKSSLRFLNRISLEGDEGFDICHLSLKGLKGVIKFKPTHVSFVFKHKLKVFVSLGVCP
jgi:hypothetical protein